MPHLFVNRRLQRLLAAAGCMLAIPAMAKTSPGFAGPLTVHLRSDRMTLRMAKAPQLYLAGTIDAGAVAQVQQLLQSGRLSPGTDVYLDSSHGDVASGMALGKLFRNARFNTHLGAWRSGSWRASGSSALPATCLDACAYAYLGGVYRWSPSGADRIGLHENLLPDRTTTAPGTPPPQQLRDYMASMGVRPVYFAQVSQLVMNGIAWWNTEKMAPWLVANNGRLPPTASYRKAPGAPVLTLTQEVRGNRSLMVLQCASGKFSLTARYVQSDSSAERLAPRTMYAYFEVGKQALGMRQGARPKADGDALVFTRELPFTELDTVLRAPLLAARIEVMGSPVRLGFWLDPAVVEPQTRAFYADCQALQPGYVPPPPAAKPARRSLWKRIKGVFK